MAKEKRYNLFLLLVFILITALIVLRQYGLTNAFFLLLCTLLLIEDRKLLILVYVITFPTNGFISTEYNLIGIFHVSYTINLFASIAVFIEWRAISDNTKTYLRKFKCFQKEVIC